MDLGLSSNVALSYDKKLQFVISHHTDETSPYWPTSVIMLGNMGNTLAIGHSTKIYTPDLWLQPQFTQYNA
jgi:hypothetical protein